MRKNLLFLPLVLAGLAVSSCSKYDDSALSSRVAKLEEQEKASQGLMSLTFTNTEDYAVFPNQTYEIPYATTGITSDVQIKVIGQDGVRAKLFRHDTNGGVIKVTMPSTVVDTEVIVLLSDARGYSKMYALALYQGVLTTSSDNYLVESSNSELDVPIQTNRGYTVEVPSEATSWISYEGLRALTIRNESLRFIIQENSSHELRSAVVKLKGNGVVLKTITIAQKGRRKTIAVIPGKLEEQLKGGFPYELKLTSGIPTAGDFKFLKMNSHKIRILDLSELPVTSLDFSNSRFEEVKLPNSLTYIPTRCFSGSTIRRINIPQGVTSIGEDAFSGCKNLTGPLVLPSSLTDIGTRAFQGCAGLTGTLVLPSNLWIIRSRAFEGCTGFTGTLVIPQGVTTIGLQAFSGCTGFDGDLIIEGNTRVIESAFVHNNLERLNFRAVYSKGTAPKEAERSAFWSGVAHGPEPLVLYVPKGARAKYEQAGWASQFERVEETNTWPQVTR